MGENILHIFQALAVSVFLERFFTGKIVLQPILARKQVYVVGEVCPPLMYLPEISMSLYLPAALH